MQATSSGCAIGDAWELAWVAAGLMMMNAWMLCWSSWSSAFPGWSTLQAKIGSGTSSGRGRNAAAALPAALCACRGALAATAMGSVT